jgi:hypothetical protein
MKLRLSRVLILTAPLVCCAAVAAPKYLVDARGWGGHEPARLVARAVPEVLREQAWSGKAEVEGGELLEVRLRSREGKREIGGVALEDGSFHVEAGQPMQDLAIELQGNGRTVISLTLADEEVSASVAELLTDDREFKLEDGGTVRLLLTFVYPPEGLPPISQLKPLHPRTELIVGGETKCVIAAPADGRYAALVRQLAQALGERGAAPEVIKAETLVDERLQPTARLPSDRNLIAIGNAMDDRLVDALYGRGYALASALYPGPEGYVIRTVHDPFGLGCNVLLLAGSDEDGVAEAAQRFIEGYVTAGDGDLVLEAPLVCCEYHRVEYPSIPGEWPKRMPQHRDMAYMREFCADAGVMDADGRVVAIEEDPAVAVPVVLSCVTKLAETWFYLGSEELPPLMGEMLDKNLPAFEAYQPTPTREMAAGITAFTPWWDLIEELPVFSDRVRLAVTNALLSAARLGHEPRAMHTLIREGCRQIHDENHGTNSGLQSFAAWQYFDNYYDLAEARYWMEMCDALFRGQAGSFQIAEDACGYMAACPDHTMVFALRRPETDYFERGVAREHADYMLLAGVNNLGLLTGFGDATALVPTGYFPLLARALWYYRDGRYRWALENLLHQNSGLRAYSDRIAVRDDVEPVEPVDLTGICVQPICERPVDKGTGRLEPVYLPREPIDDSRFNKICLREAWGRDRQYLLLSGMNRDGHTQHDVNCVVNFTDNGKMWLVDHEYALRRPGDHSGIVGMQDGRWIEPGGQSFVEQCADFKGTGLLRTRVSLGSLIWQRNILWLKGRWFAVLDDLTAQEPAEYFLRASWRGLGAEELLADGIRLTQEDQQMQVATDGEGSRDLTRVAFAQDSEWRSFYGIEDVAAKVLRQDKIADLAAGEAMRFAAGLCAQPSEDAAGFEVARLAEGAAAVSLGEERWLAASTPFEAEGVSCQAELALIGGDRLALADATKLSLAGEDLLAAEAPVSLEVDLVEGRMTVQRGAKTTSLNWRAKTVRIEPGEGSQEAEVDTKGITTALRRAVVSLADAALQGKRAMVAAANEPKYANAESVATAQMGAPATHLAAAGEGLFIGLGDGSVVSLDGDLRTQWQWQGEGPITALASADLDGDEEPEALVGSEDGHVCALCAGEVLWQFEIPAGEYLGGPHHAKMVLPADLDADGKLEVLLVGPFLQCLRSDGSLAWEDYYAFWRGMYRGRCEVASVADLDDDGKLEVIASFFDPYSGTRTLSHEGEPLMGRTEGFAPPGFFHGAPADNLGADLDGDGRGEVIVGYDGGLVSASFDTDGRSGESSYSCGSVLHLLLGRSAQHDPLIIATNDTCDVRAFHHRDGDHPCRLRQAWRLSVREPITAADVFDLDDDGLTEVMVGTRRGNVKVVSCDGELLAAADVFRGAVTGLAVLPGPDGPEIAVAREDGGVERLRLRLDL